jgi:hypothetical protein
MSEQSASGRHVHAARIDDAIALDNNKSRPRVYETLNLLAGTSVSYRKICI